MKYLPLPVRQLLEESKYIVIAINRVVFFLLSFLKFINRVN